MERKKMKVGELIKELNNFPRDKEIFFLKGKQIFYIDEVRDYGNSYMDKLPVIVPFHNKTGPKILTFDDFDKYMWEFITNSNNKSMQSHLLQYRKFLETKFL